MAQETIKLELKPRSVTGKAVKHLRRDGQIPAVIHDHGKPSLIVQGDATSMAKVYHQAGKHHPVELNTDKHTYTALIKTVEFEPRKHQMTHVVFNAVSANQMVEAEVPIVARYAEGDDSAPAEQAGLIVLKNLETVTVEALPKNLPDELFYDANKLVAIGDQLTVADLDVPAHVTITADPTQAIATVYEPSALAAANDAAGGGEEETEAAVVSEDGDTGEPATEEAKKD